MIRPIIRWGVRLTPLYLAAMLIAWAIGASATDPNQYASLSVDRVWATSYGGGKVLVTVTNRTADMIRWVEISCVFANNGSPVREGFAGAKNIPAFSTATVTAIADSGPAFAFDWASCRIVDVK